jgi:formylglycine-generating enzyme required for sulfatase activity
MGKFPLTQAQWRMVAGLPKINHDLNPEPSNFKGDNRPVEQVSWYEVVEFCDRVSQKTGHEYRLPSEAEWEHACRAGTTIPFHFGETINPNLVNYNGRSSSSSLQQGQYREQTTDVGSFPPNAFGLYDMHGNVREWCLDHWHESHQGAPTDGSAWMSDNKNSKRLIRSGSWFNFMRQCRSAYRYYASPDHRNDSIGFRVVCSAPRTL